MPKIVIIILFLFSGIGYTGDIDLSIEVNIDPIREVDYLQIGDFMIIVSNLGPDTAGADSNSTFPVRVLSPDISVVNGIPELIITQDVEQDNKCFFIIANGSPLPGGLPGIGYTFAIPEIPANSSMTCYGRYQIGFQSGSKDFHFQARSFSDNETNLTDNTFNFTFRIKPKPIPILNSYTIVFLILMMICIARYYKSRDIV